VTRKIKQLEVEEGARAPVPHSWRRQWKQLKRKTGVAATISM